MAVCHANGDGADWNCPWRVWRDQEYYVQGKVILICYNKTGRMRLHPSCQSVEKVTIYGGFFALDVV